jgi:OOP family OmpA-OmpF porin
LKGAKTVSKCVSGLAHYLGPIRLNHLSGSLVTITGHTDDLGDDLYNQKLSLRRAAAVREYLVGKLSEEAKVSLQFAIVGAGEAEPTFDNGTQAGRTANRRVVITVETK